MHEERTRQHIKVPVHTAIYRWAQPFVAGKTVLDAGCGTGYGTAILAEVAERVVGVDRDPGAIREAGTGPIGRNVDLRVMDCQALEFPRESFDVVFSNALMEYLSDFRAFFAGARRVLRPGGVLICSTKNFELSFKKTDGSPLYPDHVQEFDAARLRAELEPHFGEISIYSERMSARAAALMTDARASALERLLVKWDIKHWIPLALRNRVRRLITGVSADEIEAADFEVVPGEVAGCWYVIGCGTKPGGAPDRRPAAPAPEERP